MFPTFRLSVVLGSLALSAACSPNPVSNPNSDKADSLIVCPENADLNSAEGSQRRCVDTDSGQFVATECCADVCAGADWREQSNGTFCAWGDDPGTEGAVTGQFAPRTCCELNDELSCEVAESVADSCEDTGRGREVASACCEASPDVCHPAVANQLRSCIEDTLEDSAFDAEASALLNSEALELCANEGDLQGPMLDGLCLSDPSSEFCSMDFETFATDYVQACETEFEPVYNCVFGRTYWQISENPRIRVTDRSVLRLSDAQALSSAEQSRILLAIGESAADANITLIEGFDFVDQNEINKMQFWDGSNDLGFIAYEFGAGDNSFGAIFHAGSGELAARIVDGDIYDGTPQANLGCDVSIGPGWATCSDTADCGGGLRCEGTINEHPTEGTIGKCVDTSLGQGDPTDGNTCASNADCSFENGLLCSGLTIFDEGFCRPAWMFGSFAAEASIAIPANGSVEQDIFVYGLATVPEDARIYLRVMHPNLSDLDITVIPAGRDNGSLATVFTGATDAISGQVGITIDTNLMHPGDETLNGRWTLHIENNGSSTGSARDYALQFSSRFD